ncbi:uncharacterized protein LOC119689859 [Teleopsis dalmanni]|uniref:uncharacterized protein LOC119689859 n=1 Tax=Teleopsis dalmanni TaxID=139649 RepID=UPI0018CEC116|nr:uncharacterized protein LOC119689859 [Teleopsis dalmanni]
MENYKRLSRDPKSPFTPLTPLSPTNAISFIFDFGKNKINQLSHTPKTAYRPTTPTVCPCRRGSPVKQKTLFKTEKYLAVTPNTSKTNSSSKRQCGCQAKCPQVRYIKGSPVKTKPLSKQMIMALDSNQLSNYKQFCEREEIDISVLVDLTISDLDKLGLNCGEISKFMKAIDYAKKNFDC